MYINYVSNFQETATQSQPTYKQHGYPRMQYTEEQNMPKWYFGFNHKDYCN